MTTHPAHAKDYGLDWSRKQYGAIMPDAYYNQISLCETGLPLTKPFRAGSFGNYTKLGIHKQTALRWAGRTNLNPLSPRQVVRIADRIAFSGWTNHAGEYVWPVGPYGWASVRNGCKQTLRYLCRATHPKVQKYRARACKLESNG